MGSVVKLFHIIAQLTVIMCNHQISKATAAPCTHVIDIYFEQTIHSWQFALLSVTIWKLN